VSIVYLFIIGVEVFVRMIKKGGKLSVVRIDEYKEILPTR